MEHLNLRPRSIPLASSAATTSDWNADEEEYSSDTSPASSHDDLRPSRTGHSSIITVPASVSRRATLDWDQPGDAVSYISSLSTYPLKRGVSFEWLPQACIHMGNRLALEADRWYMYMKATLLVDFLGWPALKKCGYCGSLYQDLSKSSRNARAPVHPIFVKYPRQ